MGLTQKPLLNVRLLSGLVSKMDVKRIQEDLETGGLLIDVRSPEEYAQGHFQGSHLIPHLELTTAHLPEDKEAPIYLHCKMGPRADIGKAILQDRGYVNVTNLGGLEDMMDLGFTYIEN